MQSVLARRVCALIVDAVTIGIPAYVVCWVLCEPLIEIGQSTVFFGPPVVIAYLGLSRSSHGHHQTFGQRLCGLKLTAMDGTPLSPRRALTRAAFLSLPWCFATTEYDFKILGAASAVIMMANLYLLLFSFRDGRLLQDFLARSRVSLTEAEVVQTSALPLVHRIACEVLVVVMVVLGARGVIATRDDPLIGELMKWPGVTNAHWRVAPIYVPGQGFPEAFHILVIRKGDLADDALFALEVGKAAVQVNESAREAPLVRATVTHLINVGVAHYSHKYEVTSAPETFVRPKPGIESP